MKELMEPIDQQIMMTDDREEMLMIACVMLARSKEILVNEIGIRATIDVIISSVNDIRQLQLQFITIKMPMRKREIMNWIGEGNNPTANSMLMAMLGSDALVEKWWNSPNKAFDNKCPVDVDQKDVVEYLMFHTFGYGGS